MSGRRTRPGPRTRASPRAALLAAAILLGAAAAPARAQDTHVAIVAGLGGEPAFADAFHGWALELADAARAAGVPAERVHWLAERPEREPGRIAGRSTREAVLELIGRLGDVAAEGDRVLLLLLGHGSVRDGESALNLPGPDLAPAELAAALDALAGRTVAVVVTASASGGFVPALSGPGRVVITATRSPGEGNATRFPGHFVAAFRDGAGDADKDGRVTLLEAYEHARREVERAYRTEGLIQTEHALLDDDGDGVGTHEPAADAADGRLAASLALAAGEAVPTSADPALQALYDRRAELQRGVEALRLRKDGLADADYQARLETLLLELAGVQREIRAKEGGS